MVYLHVTGEVHLSGTVGPPSPLRRADGSHVDSDNQTIRETAFWSRTHDAGLSSMNALVISDAGGQLNRTCHEG